MKAAKAPLLAVRNVSKCFGHVTALEDVSMSVSAGEVLCLLGDNGAGKSTLIKILCGAHKPSTGQYEVGGELVEFASPQDARDRGIATVYQDLAMIPLMSVWRNFFLGSEPTRGWGPFRRIEKTRCEKIARDELEKMGISIQDPAQAVGTLSGGQRQSVAIARAMYFGAKVLFLDEPTAALGVKQAEIVLRYITHAKARGIGVILVTHNPNHAYPVGDHFVVLRQGKVIADVSKEEITLDELTGLMAGAEDLRIERPV